VDSGQFESAVAGRPRCAIVGGMGCPDVAGGVALGIISLSNVCSARRRQQWSETGYSVICGECFKWTLMIEYRGG
jgi:hypothetical protein